MAYADDLTLSSAEDTPADANLSVENAINFAWATNHGLILNVQKYDALFISSFIRKSFRSKKQLAVGAIWCQLSVALIKYAFFE